MGGQHSTKVNVLGESVSANLLLEACLNKRSSDAPTLESCVRKRDDGSGFLYMYIAFLLLAFMGLQLLICAYTPYKVSEKLSPSTLLFDVLATIEFCLVLSYLMLKPTFVSPDMQIVCLCLMWVPVLVVSLCRSLDGCSFSQISFGLTPMSLHCQDVFGREHASTWSAM